MAVGSGVLALAWHRGAEVLLEKAEPATQGQTVVFVAIDSRGLPLVADPMKPTTADAIPRIRAQNHADQGTTHTAEPSRANSASTRWKRG